MKNRTLPVKTRILLLFALLCAAVASVQSIHAATITVMNTNDGGPGSLRDALAIANDGDTIDFDSSLNGQTITLTSGQLVVNRSVTISGPGADNLTVDGNANDRVFLASPGYLGTVTISGLTITNGHAQSGGGGINNGALSTLTVSNCAISGNEGAGIFNMGTTPVSAALTVNNSTLSGNSGGGIVNEGTLGFATATVNNSTLSGNQGGGIVNSAFATDFNFAGATLTVTNSAVSGNQGGGIVNVGNYLSGATVTITNSTVSGNSASQGGGIYNAGAYAYAALTVTNSTVSGNSASQGGGIYNVGESGGTAAVTITTSTLSGNSASQGGGIYNYRLDSIDTTSLTIGDTILNAGALGENIHNESGTVSSLGYNLSSDNGAGYLTGPGDQINTDPMLGPLQDNGGPTFTHALLPGSPAINAGNPSFTPPPDYDQRGLGFDRVVNGRIDIGSFEVQEFITLSAAGRKVGGINTVRLTWGGATSANIDIYRNALLIVTTANDGSYIDSTGDTGRARYTYRVCDAGTQTCSNNATVRFQH